MDFDYVAKKITAKIIEVGDEDFPLVIDDDNIVEDHPWVKQEAVITELANEVMEPFRGDSVDVLGVILKNKKPVGLKVRHKENKRVFFAPLKDFRVGEQNILEDVYAENKSTNDIKHTLRKWNKQHDYYGQWWEGIEKFHLILARETDYLAVEVAGWYKYPSSKRPDMDGKDWRLIIPGEDAPSVINCHSILHDGVWTFTTTIHSTNQIHENQLDFIGHDDFWKRSMIWTIEVAKKLAIQGYKYKDTIDELESRLLRVDVLNVMKKELYSKIKDAQDKLGQRVDFPKHLTVGINEWIQKPKSIASYWSPEDMDGKPIGCIIISPRAFDKGEKYLRYVMMHEMIHAATGDDCRSNAGHCDEFNELSDAMKLPKKYQD